MHRSAVGRTDAPLTVAGPRRIYTGFLLRGPFVNINCPHTLAEDSAGAQAARHAGRRRNRGQRCPALACSIPSMLALGRTSLARSATRRWVAGILLAVLAFSRSESLIADVHDGDARNVDVRDRDAHSGDGRVALSAVAAIDVMTAVSPATPSAPDHGTPDGSTHAFHICHCAHTHVAGLPRPAESDGPVLAVDERLFAHADQMPESASREAALRPPAPLLVA